MNKTKYLAPRFFLPLTVVALAPSTQCFGLFEVSRGLVLLQTTGSVTYDSYFIGTKDNKPDTIYSLYPSLRFTRNAGRGTIAANAGVSFNRYDVNQDLDSDDLRGGFSIELPTVEGARLDGNFAFTYTEATVVDLAVNDRVASRNYSAEMGFNYRLNPRMTLSESFGYTSSARDIYSDQESLSNNLSFRYNGFLRGTSLSLSHGLTITGSSGDNYAGVDLDQQSNTLSIGLSRAIYSEVIGSLSYGYTTFTRSAGETFGGEARSTSSSVTASIEGPFLPRRRFPKLTSSAGFSYSQSASAGLGDAGGKFLSGHMSLAWSAREKTKLNVRANRSMSLSVADLSVENTRVGGGIDQQIGQKTNVSSSVNYTWSTYRGITRSDEILEANAGINRSFNKYLSAGASYMYQNNSNTSSGFQPGRFVPRSYERHTATVSATVTF